jgi:Na+/glutamate symporter
MMDGKKPKWAQMAITIATVGAAIGWIGTKAYKFSIDLHKTQEAMKKVEKIDELVDLAEEMKRKEAQYLITLKNLRDSIKYNREKIDIATKDNEDDYKDITAILKRVEKLEQ